jgi:transcription elongation GreA/GreB family factor
MEKKEKEYIDSTESKAALAEAIEELLLQKREIERRIKELQKKLERVESIAQYS